MRTVIVYGSQYGTAKRYAEALAGRTESEIRSCEDLKDLDVYDNIVFIGALYAGGVLGLKKTLSGIHDLQNKKIVIATVGLADPNDRENTETIRNGLKKQLPENICNHASIFHLRGGIDYSRLNLKHRTMMALLYRKAKGLPEEKKTAEVRAMIDTYGKRVDFVDLSSLDPIIREIGYEPAK
jgi:menaquinone-dependent protoporphyrinogen IX oxidase